MAGEYRVWQDLGPHDECAGVANVRESPSWLYKIKINKFKVCPITINLTFLAYLGDMGLLER